MKDNFLMIKNKGKEFCKWKIKVFIMEYLKMINLMDMVNYYGQMEKK